LSEQPRRRITKKKLARAAELAKELNAPVQVGEFTIHPPRAANDAKDDEGERIQRQLDAMRPGKARA